MKAKRVIKMKLTQVETELALAEALGYTEILGFLNSQVDFYKQALKDLESKNATS